MHSTRALVQFEHPPGALSHLTFRWAHSTHEKAFWIGLSGIVIVESGVEASGEELGAGIIVLRIKSFATSRYHHVECQAMDCIALHVNVCDSSAWSSMHSRTSIRRSACDGPAHQRSVSMPS